MARIPHAQPAPPPPEPTTTEGGPSAAEACGVLTVDLAAIHANYRMLAARVVPGECAAVVKADAYGCGIEPVTETLVRAGCQTFFVAHLAEARRVRAVAPEAAIYVLNGFSSAAGPGFVETYARPVINSSVELAEWDHFVATTGWSGGAALHVDTGMNRLGLTVEEAAAVATRLQTGNHGIALLMSHLACADQPDHPLNDRQIRQFREIRSLFRGIASSLANSPGIFLDSSTYCDLVRPGVALYGGAPMPLHTNPMRPVVELQARILQVRNVQKGDTVGYGAAFTAKRDSRIAVIAAGYADGIQRSPAVPEAQAAREGAGGREVIVAGKRCRMVGRVSMDLTAVDVTDLPVVAVRRDAMATLIGDGLSLDEVAAQTGTIAYEVLTNLGRRFHRVWKV
jgi:alanine racemase